MMIAHAGRNIQLINQSVDAFVKEAALHGWKITVVDYPDGGHAFDIEQDTDESRATISAAVTFVKRRLGPGFFRPPLARVG